MSTLEPGHFLMSVINGAEDVEVFLGKYNACHADDVLRSGVDFDERPLVIVGSEKRHMMCKRKLPIKFKELKLTYDESKIYFITETQLKEFVTNALADIRGGVVENPEVLKKDNIIDEVGNESQTVDDTQNSEEVIGESEVVEGQSGESEYEQEQENVDSSNVKKSPPTSSNGNGGLCRYGVPKFKVDYIAPQVMGLRESLFVNVEEEDLKQFFNAVKGRVITSINKDI